MTAGPEVPPVARRPPATRPPAKLALAAILLPAILLVTASSPALAQDRSRDATRNATDDAAIAGTAAAGPMIVATKSAPPFALRDEDGTWSGISIALWESVAAELGLDYRFEEASLVDMVADVADGRFDASVAATTITPGREREVDFSHPFYTTGFAIVVRRTEESWRQMIRSLFSFEFFYAIALLALVLSVVGSLFWLAERRGNAAEFRREPHKGLGDGFWFAAVTMTTTGYGDMAPRSLAGRLVGLVWMFTALLITSTFTGMIASSLTAERLSFAIGGPDDLPDAAVGSVASSAGDDWLGEHGIAFTSFENAAAGLDAVANGDIDAFVYDRPLLRHLLDDVERRALELVPGSFGRQDYGIALPAGSALREPLNRALLHYLDTDASQASLTRHLGAGD